MPGPASIEGRDRSPRPTVAHRKPWRSGGPDVPCRPSAHAPTSTRAVDTRGSADLDRAVAGDQHFVAWEHPREGGLDALGGLHRDPVVGLADDHVTGLEAHDLDLFDPVEEVE